MTVILLHGLAHWPFVWLSDLAMSPLGVYLGNKGHDVRRETYEGDTEDHDAIVERIASIVDQIEGRVVLVGHSYGGVIARSVARRRGDRICTVVAIASPLNGAAMLDWMTANYPSLVNKSKGYELIRAIEPNVDIAPVKFYSVSVGRPGNPEFDTCVYRSEATAPDGHAHIDWSEHRLAVLDPRVWQTVHAFIAEQE